MDKFTQILIVSVISIIVVIILLFVLWINIRISTELNTRNEGLKKIIVHERKLNDSLISDIKFQKTVTKTFSDGLEALNKKQK